MSLIGSTIGILNMLQSPQESPVGAVQICEKVCGNYSHKVKKEGELGAVLKSLNCWTQSSVTPFCLSQWLAEEEPFRKDHTHWYGLKESRMTIKLWRHKFQVTVSRRSRTIINTDSLEEVFTSFAKVKVKILN